ncbi:MAG: hypothetical protein ABIH19_02435 [Candidatus Omnitrophota bacterium]
MQKPAIIALLTVVALIVAFFIPGMTLFLQLSYMVILMVIFISILMKVLEILTEIAERCEKK